MPPAKRKPSDPEETTDAVEPQEGPTTTEQVEALPPVEEMPDEGVVMAEGPVSENIAVSDANQEHGEGKYPVAVLASTFAAQLEAEPYLIEGVLNAQDGDEFTVDEARQALKHYLTSEVEG